MKVGTLSRIARWAGGLCVALVMAGVSSVGHAAVLSPSTPLEYISGYIPATGDLSFSQSYNVTLSPLDHLVRIDYTDISTTFSPPGNCLTCGITDLMVTFNDGVNSPFNYNIADFPVTFLLAAGTYDFTISGHTKTDGGAFDVKLSAVPIPGAALLFGSGLAFLGLSGRRRFKKAAV